MARLHEKKSRTVGFTLVELLVVIGIIAVLISLLLPALNRARDQANTVACMSNMRQMGQAFQMYSNENQNWIVPGGYRTAPSGGNEDCWPLLMAHLKLLPSQGLTQADATTNTAPNSVFVCPSMNDHALIGYHTVGVATDGFITYNSLILEPVGTGYPNGLVIKSSYGMDSSYNDNVGYNNTTAEYNTYDSTTVGMHKLNSIRDASDHVLLFDGYYIMPENGTNLCTIRGRHHNFKDTNLLYLDGHVDSVPRNSMSTKTSDFITAPASFNSPAYVTIKTPPFLMWFQGQY